MTQRRRLLRLGTLLGFAVASTCAYIDSTQAILVHRTSDTLWDTQDVHTFENSHKIQSAISTRRPERIAEQRGTGSQDATLGVSSATIIPRQLRRMTGFDSTPLTSREFMFGWFCFVAICLVIFVACCVCCVMRDLRSLARRTEREQEEQSNAAISRIEANVKVFAQKEDQRRMQTIRRTMKRNLFVSSSCCRPRKTIGLTRLISYFVSSLLWRRRWWTITILWRLPTVQMNSQDLNPLKLIPVLLRVLLRSLMLFAMSFVLAAAFAWNPFKLEIPSCIPRTPSSVDMSFMKCVSVNGWSNRQLQHVLAAGKSLLD